MAGCSVELPVDSEPVTTPATASVRFEIYSNAPILGIAYTNNNGDLISLSDAGDWQYTATYKSGTNCILAVSASSTLVTPMEITAYIIVNGVAKRKTTATGQYYITLNPLSYTI